MPGTVGFSSQGFQGGCWNNRALGWEEFHGLNHGLIPRSQGVQLAGPESQPWAPPCGNPSSGPQRDMCLHLLAHLCGRAWCILGTLPVEKSFVAKIRLQRFPFLVLSLSRATPGLPPPWDSSSACGYGHGLPISKENPSVSHKYFLCKFSPLKM